jgi:hypothetical protein
MQKDNLEAKVEERLRSIGKTKDQLAEYADLSSWGLTKMLRRGTFKTDYMLKISKFLGVDISFFGVENNQGSKNVEVKPTFGSTEVDHLKESLKAKDEVIRAKDEIIRAKDEIIATLKEKRKT